MNLFRVLRWAALAAFFPVLLPGLSRADTNALVPTRAGSGITMRVSTPLTVMPQFGFLPVLVSVQNQSTRSGIWTLRFVAGNALSPTGSVASTLEVTAPAGQERAVWYFVPLADAAARFTLGERPNPNSLPRPAIFPAAAASPSTNDVESRAQTKLGSGPRLNWSSRMERGDRPGELVGIAIASQAISNDLKTPTGRDLPPGFDVEDAFDPITGWYTRRYIYKEVVPDPAGGSAPKSSFWSTVSSSLTAESAAREALAASGLLTPAPGVEQTVEVAAIETGFSDRQASWLTTFVQTGSSRVLPLQPGQTLPPGTIMNLHPTGRPGEVRRTITFVEPAALVPPTDFESKSAPVAAEARTTLLRYGFLRPQPEVRVSTEFPGAGAFTPSPQHQGAAVWFESGPARLLPKPLFGTLPPGTAVYLLPGAGLDDVIRCFVVAPPPRLRASVAAGGGAPGSAAQFSATVTGPGIVGAAVMEFPTLQSAPPGLALPIAVSNALTAKLRQTLSNAAMRGVANLTAIDVATLPTDWRFFSPYHLVFLRGAEYAALNPTQKSALHDWVLQGGQLMIEPVAVYSPDDLPLIEPRVPLEVRPYGAGTITQLSYLLDDYLAPMDIDESIPDQPVWVKMAEPVELLPLLRLYETALTLPSDEALRQPKRSPDLEAGDSKGDGRWAVVILAGFALFAGPVNLLVFAPAGRRHRLFFTTPLLALAFTGVLVLCVLAWEGMGGVGDRAAVVLLVPGENRAVVYQDQTAATTLLGRRGFALPGDAAMANVAVEGFDATGRAAALERGEDGAGGDWFRNHWASAQHIRRIVPTAGSVRIRPGPNGTPVVESTLPAALRSFIYLGPGNRVWYAPEVPVGQVVTLRRLNVSRWPPMRPYGSPYLMTVLVATAPSEAGHWIARSGGATIAPVPTLGAVNWRDDVVFTGLAEVR